MKIQTLVSFNGYSLLICHCSGNLYHLSIIDREIVVHTFEGIYPTLQNAIARGKSIIQNLDAWSQTTSNQF